MTAIATPATVWDENWPARASCRGGETPDELFAKGAAQQSAKAICQRCPVVAECLADALDNHTEYGVWGGMTERERRALLRNRPEVKSWTTLFKTARADEYYGA
jgi:WhiB family redox-sensing transcriptional regulator